MTDFLEISPGSRNQSTQTLPDQRPRLDREDKDRLAAALLRDPILFSFGCAIMPPQLIDPIVDAAFLCVWRAAANVAKRNQDRLPTPEAAARLQIRVECKNVARLDPDSIRPENLTHALKLTDAAYELKPAELTHEEGKSLLKAYVEERTVFDEIARMGSRILSDNKLLPSSLQQFVDKLEKQQATLKSLSLSQAEAAFFDPASSAKIKLHTTGCDFLDRQMNGGCANGEAYTIMAPTGSGKTTLGVQLFMAGALLEQESYDDDQTEALGEWHYFNYEDHGNLQVRLWAHAAEIDWTRLASVGSSPLSTSDTLEPYEEERFATRLAKGEKVPGETERLAAADAMYRKHPNHYLHDMTGQVPGVGNGGIDEMVRLLELRLREPNRRIAGVVIDYAGLVVQRHFDADHAGSDPKGVYTMLNSFVQTAVSKIVARFHCKVWVLHQLHGSAGKKSPTASHHHSEAQGSRNFCDAAWFAFQIGNKDPFTGLVQIEATKSRRAKGGAGAALVRLDGAVCRMVDTENAYQCVKVLGAFVRRCDSNRIARPSAPAKRRQGRR